MEIALLTSSRADYGFLRPLLKAAQKQKNLRLNLIVFGTHLSHKHGYTIKSIVDDGYKIYKKLKILPAGDNPADISKNMGEVHVQFAGLWKKNKFDLILCLGDRYEIYAAVSASIPFNIPVAHISGGETTNGSIDNYFRNALTLMARYHFTNTAKNAERVKEIIGSDRGVFHTGSLAIDNILSTKVLTKNEFRRKFLFDIGQPFILFTFHPETVDYDQNRGFGKTIKKILSEATMPVLATLPNADTMGDLIADNIKAAAKKNPGVFVISSLGSAGYYTALKYCKFVMGNSSSGIVEAATFKKYVLNLGKRQDGRERNNNVIDVRMDEKSIRRAMEKIPTLEPLNGSNQYGDGRSAGRILNILNRIARNDYQ